jgi:hypothetical protein
MAARVNKIRHDSQTRAKIQSAQIINRLHGYVMGKLVLEPAQVSAGLGLLRKTLPDLSQAALTDGDGGPLQVSVMRFAEKD